MARPEKGVLDMDRSAVEERLVYPLQKRVINPIVLLAHNLGFPPPGNAPLETTGRRTGVPRYTAVCDGLETETFWRVAQRGRRVDWRLCTCLLYTSRCV